MADKSNFFFQTVLSMYIIHIYVKDIIIVWFTLGFLSDTLSARTMLLLLEYNGSQIPVYVRFKWELGKHNSSELPGFLDQ